MARTRYQRTGELSVRNGKWWLRYRATVLDAKGNLDRKKLRIEIGPAEGPGKLTKAQAERKADVELGKANQRESQPVALMSFGDYYNGPYQAHLQATSSNNQDSFVSIMQRHILPALGSLTFLEITPQRVQELINVKKAQQYSPASLKHIRKGISAVWHHARRNRVIEVANPAEEVVLPRVRAVRPHQALTAEQVAYGSTRLEAPYDAMLLLASCASLGPAELTGLKWMRVNLADTEVLVPGKRLPPRSLWVSENWTKGQSGDTKTEDRNRILPIPDCVLPLLLKWRQTSRFTKPSDFVFAAQESKDGNPVSANNANKRQFATLSESLGVHVTWYSFRHTFATLFEMAGGRSFEKKMLMGHSRSEDITDGYTHTTFEKLRERVNAIAQLITAERKEELPAKVRMIR
jgi:integrase